MLSLMLALQIVADFNIKVYNFVNMRQGYVIFYQYANYIKTFSIIEKFLPLELPFSLVRKARIRFG